MFWDIDKKVELEENVFWDNYMKISDSKRNN